MELYIGLGFSTNRELRDLFFIHRFCSEAISLVVRLNGRATSDPTLAEGCDYLPDQLSQFRAGAARMPHQIHFPYEYERIPEQRNGELDDMKFGEASRTWWGKWRWKRIAVGLPVAVIFFL